MCLEGLRKSLKKHQFPGYLITDLNNIYYFTGFKDVPGAMLALIIPIEDSPTLLTPPLSYAAAQEQAENCEVQKIPERLHPTQLWQPNKCDSRLESKRHRI